MAKKSFRVQVELEIQSVTCPGVWLCPHGKLSLQVYMLNSCIETTPAAPVFPLFIDERFIFSKTFASANKLNELLRAFNKEHLYAELIQWQDCNKGNVLCNFETSLSELLFPSSCDVDLLMEPTRIFPGIISPKIEICTKTTIDEVCTVDKTKSYCSVINPKTITSLDCKDLSDERMRKRQFKVCHSGPYHRRRIIACENKNKRKNKPPFMPACRPRDSLIFRKPEDMGPSLSRDGRMKNSRKLKRFRQGMRDIHVHSETRHKLDDGCRICECYKKSFEDTEMCSDDEVDEISENKCTNSYGPHISFLCYSKNDDNYLEQRNCCTKQNRKLFEDDNYPIKSKANKFRTCRKTITSRAKGSRTNCKCPNCNEIPKCRKLVKKKSSYNSTWVKKKPKSNFQNECKQLSRIMSDIKKCLTRRTKKSGKKSRNNLFNNLDNDSDDDDDLNTLMSKYCNRSLTKTNNNGSSSLTAINIDNSVVLAFDKNDKASCSCKNKLDYHTKTCDFQKSDEDYPNKTKVENKLELKTCYSEDSLISDFNNSCKSSRIHPFQKQIDQRTKPCVEEDGEAIEKWCSYYGTPCSGNKTNLNDKIKIFTDNTSCYRNTIYDDKTIDLSDSDDDCEDCCKNLLKKLTYNADDDCNNYETKCDSTSFGFSDSFNKFCDSFYKTIRTGYEKFSDKYENSRCIYSKK